MKQATARTEGTVGRPLGRPARKRERVDRALKDKGMGGLVETLLRVDWKHTTYAEAAAMICGATGEDVDRTTIPVWREWAAAQPREGAAA